MRGRFVRQHLYLVCLICLGAFGCTALHVSYENQYIREVCLKYEEFAQETERQVRALFGSRTWDDLSEEEKQQYYRLVGKRLEYAKKIPEPVDLNIAASDRGEGLILKMYSYIVPFKTHGWYERLALQEDGTVVIWTEVANLRGSHKLGSGIVPVPRLAQIKEQLHNLDPKKYNVFEEGSPGTLHTIFVWIDGDSMYRHDYQGHIPKEAREILSVVATNGFRPFSLFGKAIQ